MKSIDRDGEMNDGMKPDTSQLSLEGMKIMHEQINLNRMSLVKRNKVQKDAKNEFQSSMRNHLMGLISKIRVIRIHVTTLTDTGFEEHLAVGGLDEILDRYEQEKERKHRKGQKIA